MVELSIIKYLIEHPEEQNKLKYLDLSFVKTNFPNIYKLVKSLNQDVTSIEELEASYLSNYPAFKEAERKELTDLLNRVSQASSGENILRLLETHRNRAKSSELAIIALDVSEGKRDAQELHDKYTELSKTEIEEEDFSYLSTDITQLALEEEETPGLSWRLRCLNQALGPLRKGNFGHIFARVETGKSAMWISEVTHMMSQLKEDENVLIFFNEEGGKDIIWRMHSAVTGWPYLQCKTNLKQARDKWIEAGGDKILFFDEPELVNKTSIEAIIKKHKPGLIIIDNMDKVKGFTADRKDLLLHEIYKWGRDIAKTHCPVISVGQADLSADNREWVTEAQMADSKTGKPSELDFIIAIGRTDKEGYENVRYIHLPKNKLRGAVEGLRHLKAEVLIQPEISRYKDM